MHLVSRKPSGIAVAAGFFLSLKKHLAGGRIDALRLVNGDRVVELQVAARGSVHLLIFELIGSSANLILADTRHTVLAVLRPVPPGDKVKRPLLPGLLYEPPAPGARKTGTQAAHIPLSRPDGYTGPAPVNAAAERWYEEIAAERAAAALRAELAGVVRKAAEKAMRRRAALEKDISGAEQGDAYRAMGELILANKHLLHKGQTVAELAGYDGTTMAVNLDPSRSPSENAGAYFRRFKKAKAGIAVMRERFDQAQHDIVYLLSVLDDLKAADGPGNLREIRSLLSGKGYVKEGTGKVAGKRTASAPPFRTVRHDGWDILIGKSAAGNDYITMQLARPDDLWLHAEGMPGSHVVVRNPGKRDIPEGVLKKAASLAAYYSKGKNAGKVPVAYTRAAYVRKPKGAAPGSVLLTERKTLMAAPVSDPG